MVLPLGYYFKQFKLFIMVSNTEKESVFSLVNVVHSSPKGVITEQDIEVWTHGGLIPKDTPVEQILLFAKFCAETDLSPTRRQICLISMWDKNLKGFKYMPFVTNDGLRTLLNREGIYFGCEPTRFNERSNGTYDTFTDVVENMQKTGNFPLTCTFTGYSSSKRGQKVAYTKTVVFSEFYKADSYTWGKMPLQMIEKTAKSFVYKEMLGDKMSGLAIEEEIDFTDAPATIELQKDNTPKDTLTDEAERIAELSDLTEQNLIELVNDLKLSHGIKNLDLYPKIAKILRGKLRSIREEAAKQAEKDAE